MSRMLLPPISYRHVIFPDSAEESDRPFNFTPVRKEHEAAEDESEFSSDEYAGVRWLFERAGLNADDYRRETLKRRIPACLRALRLETPAQLRTAIQRHPDLMKAAVNALVIGVTGFFRDPTVFSTLNQMILPELLSRSHGPRIWSAGCSDGSELYSVAMLLAERGAMRRCSLLGTDCRSTALARAREGCYDAASVKNVPAGYLSRYFQPEDRDWRVHSYLRTVVQWRSGDVLTTPEPGSWDLILCRNMAIYMQPAAAARLWARLEQCLRPGGIIVLGKAERPLGTTGLKLLAPCIYRRNGS